MGTSLIIFAIGIFVTLAAGESVVFTWKENMEKAEGKGGREYSYDPLENFSEKSGINVVAMVVMVFVGIGFTCAGAIMFINLWR